MGLRSTAVLVSVCLALIFAFGCGGSDEDSSGSQSSQSSEASGEATNASSENSAKAAFVEQATTACEAHVEGVQTNGTRIFREHGEAGEEKLFRTLLVNKVIVPEFKGEAEDLEALQPPPGDEDEIAKLVAAIDHIVRQVETNPFAEGGYPYKEAERLSSEYGIPKCGSPDGKNK
ncbi:MAG TPA: hypothetical protein VK615_07685 [Candidatus Binatia bacterium]|nr:hypothetical protein [Candidatus Binatia bacterium]